MIEDKLVNIFNSYDAEIERIDTFYTRMGMFIVDQTKDQIEILYNEIKKTNNEILIIKNDLLIEKNKKKLLIEKINDQNKEINLLKTNQLVCEKQLEKQKIKIKKQKQIIFEKQKTTEIINTPNLEINIDEEQIKKIYEKIKETLIDDENVLKKIGVNMRKKMRYFDDLHAELAEVNFKINDPKTGLESLHCDYHYLAKTTKKYNKKANDELFDFEMERSKMRDVMDRTKRYKDDCDEVLKK